MTPPTKERFDWITVGVVVAPQGVRGEVRVKPLTDFPDRFLTTKRIYALTSSGRIEYPVERARPHARGLYVLKLAGLDDRDGAEALRQVELQVPRDEVVPLPEGRYYVFELVGARVETSAGRLIGRLVDVLHTGANDVYQVEDDHGNEVLIPAIKQVVLSIDPDAGLIVVDPPEGLL